MSLRFRILGPLDVERDGRPVSVGGAKQRTLLAVLLLHANEVMPTQRLVAELWGPEAPPSSVKLVQGYVSNLRKALGDRLVTRAPGYVLRVEAGELDLHEFEHLVAAGRIRDALGLWRGEAVADVVFEDGAQRDAERLNELRLAALEERIDADLERGRAAGVAAELESLVRAHPYRERFREQLMLALYRAGRQADALAVYRDARRFLAGELGIEPGPRLRELEAAILRQDPALAAVAAPRQPRRRRRVALTAAIAALAVATAAVALLVRDEAAAPLRLAPTSLAFFDGEQDAFTKQVQLGPSASDLAVDGDTVWVAKGPERLVMEVDARQARIVRTAGIGDAVFDVAAGGGDVWVVTNGPILVRLDPVTMSIKQRIRVGTWRRIEFLGVPQVAYGHPRIALASGSVWVSGGRWLWRVDAASRAVVARLTFRKLVMDVAAGDAGLWVLDATRRVSKVDTRTNRVVAAVRLPLHGARLAVDDDVWVTAQHNHEVWRIDPLAVRRTAAIPAGYRPFDVSPAAGAVWVTSAEEPAIRRIDPATNTVVETLELPHAPHSLVAVDGGVWLLTAT